MAFYGMKRMRTEAIQIFKAGVKAVKPEYLIAKSISIRDTSELVLQEKSFPIANNVYVVGFGKAVVGMAVAMEKMLGDHLVKGIISAPVGIMKQINHTMETQLKWNSCIEILEGAKDNLPDEESLKTASLIAELVSALKETDLLIVLISGGGSALLPAPSPGITLQEKLRLTRLLASAGADIQEINAVRKRLSTLKGGHLAQLAKPAKVISLILSDIVGNPLDLIASGPTVLNTDVSSLPLQILEKYNLTNKVPQVAALLKQISEEEAEVLPSNFDHVTNIIIGSNKDAISAAFCEAEKCNYKAIVLTLELQGIASNVGKHLASLASALISRNISTIKQSVEHLKLPDKSVETLLEKADEAQRENKHLCLLCAGETVVEVRGMGMGGRNQELALAAAIELHAQNKYAITLISAGTDGIDGPTKAAGAIATSELINIAEKQGLIASEFLKNNDSYNFYRIVDNGKWHVITGHTNTNVMDLVIILIQNISL